MLVKYAVSGGRLLKLDTSPAPSAEPDAPAPRPVWFDMLHPMQDEEAEVEALLGIDVPTREDMDEIEHSSRIYAENGAVYLTASVLSASQTLDPVLAPITFVLTPGALVTLRYHEPRAINLFAERAQRSDHGLTGAVPVLLALLDALVDRVADLLEHEGKGIDAIARHVFSERKGRPRQAREFSLMMERIGQRGELNTKIRESLVTFERIAGAIAQHLDAAKTTRDQRGRVKTLVRDIRSLTEHAGFHAGRITFLLDATLGLVGIEQNGIIKIFSVAAVVRSCQCGAAPFPGGEGSEISLCRGAYDAKKRQANAPAGREQWL
ncbi:MAG: magnesium transporter [Alphaproteobacteria bacterium HGW-Alphaproteobacteria-2]|nr:MAG: magnesium transporter [Alphaproteobacteria bacterium HGW-Alphaproteobacteria-2]